MLKKIRNIDETPVYIDSPTNRTIVPVGSTTVTIADSGHSKDRFSVCVDVGADGTMNKALILIARQVIPKSWVIPSNLIVYPSEKATMSEFIMKKYIDDYLSVSFYGNGILLMDEFAAHKTEDIIKKLYDIVNFITYLKQNRQQLSV